MKRIALLLLGACSAPDVIDARPPVLQSSQADRLEVGRVSALGGTVVRYTQTVDGIPVDGSELSVLGEVTTGTPLPAGLPHSAQWTLDEAAAVSRVITHTHGAAGDVTVDQARAQRVWFRAPHRLEAAWKVEAYSRSPRADGAWSTLVAASDGRVLAHRSLVADAGVDYRVFADAMGRPTSPLADFSPHPTGVPDGSYPEVRASTLVHADPANAWLTGTETVGNNVDAYADLERPDGFSAGDLRAAMTAPGVFDHTFDVSQPPLATLEQQRASVTQLFYTVNWLHDFWYEAGFTEAAGNAQTDNYGLGGIAGDVLLAEGQDDAGRGRRNNANMAVPSDGLSPRMQVYLWDGTPELDGSLDVQLVAHEFGHYLHHRLSPSANPAGLAMSEGWGDFLALMIAVGPEDDLRGAFPIVIYATRGHGDDAGYYGIRRLAYSADPEIDALTFRHMRTSEPLPTTAPMRWNEYDNAELHNAGEVWTTALWQGYVALQEAGTDFAEVHRKMARYVVAGLALTPPSATPTEARDALLAAAAANSLDDARVLAAAFAQRGLGTCARSAPRESATFDEIREATAVTGVPVVELPRIDDSAASCDADGVLDAGETARVALPIKNLGFVALTGVQVTLTTTTPGLTATAAPVGLTRIEPGESVEAVFEVGLSDAAAVEATFMLQVATPDACTPMTEVPVTIRLNVDDAVASSATDHFDTATDVFTPSSTAWTRAWRSARDGYWHAPTPEVLTDAALVSPPLAASGPVTVSFSHRYQLDPDDGGVVEITTDGGATWRDLSELGAVAYDGPIRAFGSALDGREAFRDRNAAYPAATAVAIDLGAALVGQTFQLRFRVVSSDFDFASDAPPGWDLDDIAVTGVGTAFPSVVAEPGACEPEPPLGPDAATDDDDGTPPTPPLEGGCCGASGGGGNGWLALGVLGLLARRRRSVLLLGLAACGPEARVEPDAPVPPPDIAITVDAGPDAAADCGCPIGTTCVEQECISICTADGVDKIYVVSDTLEFLSFNPRKLPDEDPFTLIGTLACPVTGESIQSPPGQDVRPFSMGIDRNGVAWVEYTSGEVFNVALDTAACTATAYVPQAAGIKLFGMGFVTDESGGDTEHLFISDGNNNARPGGQLARVDTSNPPFTPDPVGAIPAYGNYMAELTGTAEGRLYGFFPSLIMPAFVSELDPATGAVLGSRFNLGQGGLGSDVAGWAFAFWGNRFYVFVTSDDNSTVRMIDRATGEYSIILRDLPHVIVGAGVSTCAPVVEP